MRFSILFTGVSCIAACSAAPTANNHNFELHEKRDGSPHQWRRRHPAHPNDLLPVRIGLTQRNLHKAEEYILDVSDPSSPNFGKHWSAEKVANIFAPAKKTQDAVADWLVKFGIEVERQTYSTGRNWIQFNATVAETEALFNTKYHYYEHKVSGGYRIACDEYHLPKDVREHIDFAV